MPLIISVGNITLGGTGKTPFTIFLGQHYMALGKKIAILSRGYKGRLGYGLNVISDGRSILHHPPEAADEPYMMAQSLPGAVVITGKNRRESYTYALQNFSPDIVLLDDAYQHRKMMRDVNILLLDYNNPVSTGFPFPFGYLREFPSAISRADIVVFTRARTTEIPSKVAKYCRGKRVFFAEALYTEVVIGGRKADIKELAGKKVWLMSAIAKPVQFEEQIRSCYVKILGHTIYRDHYAYSASDIESVLSKAEKHTADIILTTHKDYVKIPAGYCYRFAYPELSVHMLNSGLFEAIDSV